MVFVGDKKALLFSVGVSVVVVGVVRSRSSVFVWRRRWRRAARAVSTRKNTLVHALFFPTVVVVVVIKLYTQQHICLLNKNKRQKK